MGIFRTGIHHRVVNRAWYDTCTRLPRDENDDPFELGPKAAVGTIRNKTELRVLVAEKVLLPLKGPLPVETALPWP